MSLFKQLLLLISALFLMIFSINFVLSVNNIKSYLEGESAIHAQDTATSLGLSLSPYLMDESDPIIETTMSAIFDRGYYQELKLVNVDQQLLVRLTHNKAVEAVPAWFIKLIPMRGAIANSEISSGWNITGVIYVTLNPTYAYTKLYEQALKGFYYSLVIFVLSISLLFLLLRATLSSLKRIEQLALKVSAGKFEVIKQLPWTTDVRNVTVSMNTMSKKIERAIDQLNNKLDHIGEKLQQDDLTGLNKKPSFETDIKQLFITDVSAFILLIKIDALSGLVKMIGREEIDIFLNDVASILLDTPKKNTQSEVSAYRFFGSEFALLMRNINEDQVKIVAESLSGAFAVLGRQYQKLDIAHIGVTVFNPLSNIEEMLLAANEAYEQAQLIGQNSYYIRKSDDPAHDIAEWKQLVFSTIDHQGYSVSFIGQIECLQTGRLLMEDAFTGVVNTKGDAIAMGTFVSIAEKFDKIIKLDKGVVLKAIDYIYAAKITHAVTINVSTRTIKNSDFRSWLATLVKNNPIISQQLVFSLSAYAVAKDVSIYKEFIVFAHQLKTKVLIKRFETQSLATELIKELQPDYIRLARNIGNGIAQDDGKKAFVSTILEIGNFLDMIILAENIQLDSDLSCLKGLGITGASR